MVLIDELKEPGAEFTPIPLWFLNDDLSADELRRQLEDFHAHGVDGVVLHPRIGMARRIGYLSDTFFGYIAAALEKARELHMRVVFYDEGMYPSGSACGQVVEGHPELASRGIVLTDVPAAGDRVLCQHDGRYLVARFSGGSIRGIHYGEDDGEPDAPRSADILNPKAVSRFIELTHEAYYRRFSSDFGKTVIGFFTDEPSILGRCAPDGMRPWTDGFEDVFTAAGGRLEGLFALFENEENEDTALYERLIVERENEVYYLPLSRWCSDHSIALMGHPASSDDIERERHFHIPGQDLVFRQVSPEAGDLVGRDSVQAKCSADAARLLGRRRNSNECLGVCGECGNPWHLTGADMKWFIDYLAVRGVNMFIPHAFYYSIAGARRDERPPDVGPNSIWWPHYNVWSRYMRRLSCLMTDTELIAPVAVLCRNRELIPDTVAELFRSQIGFMYIPESLWGECRDDGGLLFCRGMRFSAVVDPENRFPGVDRNILSVCRDIVCDTPQPSLRAIHFRRLNTECVFVVNAGEGIIDTGVSLPFGGFSGQCDLWSGETRRFDGRLTLPRRASLLIFACDRPEYEALPDSNGKNAPSIKSPEFTCVNRDLQNAAVTYAATLPKGPGGVMTLEAEEAAELTVNGRFAGFSFWGPHRFDLTGLLTEETNALRLVVTGSRAAVYGRSVPFGIIAEERR